MLNKLFGVKCFVVQVRSGFLVWGGGEQELFRGGGRKEVIGSALCPVPCPELCLEKGMKFSHPSSIHAE